jgi:hypothetical protein
MTSGRRADGHDRPGAHEVDPDVTSIRLVTGVVEDRDCRRGDATGVAQIHDEVVDGDLTVVEQVQPRLAPAQQRDEFVKQDGVWRFARRRLMVDWTETRPSTA